jgi:hypothetical protein
LLCWLCCLACVFYLEVGKGDLGQSKSMIKNAMYDATQNYVRLYWGGPACCVVFFVSLWVT